MFYTPMFYNPKASETILSPQSICETSHGLLDKWTQSGSVSASTGDIVILDHKGAEVISLRLHKRNGLYYTPVETVGVDDGAIIPASKNVDYCIHFHREDGLPDDVSLVAASVSSSDSSDESLSDSIDNGDPFYHQPTPAQPAQSCTRPPITLPTPIGPTMPPMSVPTPKSSPSLDDFIPKAKQIEADLWSARLGHCSNWQLKVIPQSTEGTPGSFHPHPFASYDHYNKARIRKRAATRGKHPSRATQQKQRLSMDFGFMRASQFDYSRPDKSKDRVVTSFDGFN